MPSLFHLAFHVTDLDVARRFYGDVLGCREGRSTGTWVDFDFEGHQLSLHLGEPFRTARTGAEDPMKLRARRRCASPCSDSPVLAAGRPDGKPRPRRPLRTRPSMARSSARSSGLVR